ncbi:hypothetical protein [Methylovulum psychrotolerans]|uniref:Uncharacterized protein n=1 Tax=Methylovulum psychrotolerans TaxID=1704499 RepID=A0A1Z4C2I0_9GAMM|nr:hypothetical protein [Methylovulum psychrotolerans]ASF47719.1 hypothetical protein CEK71_17505 [Methylovulum psychrotolerans]
MLKHLLLIGLLFSGTCAAKDITYTAYENGAAEYSVAIPDGILYGQGESGNHMGQVFKSEDMDAVLFTYGEGNIDDKGIDALFFDALHPDDKAERVFVYQAKGDDWFVVTGFYKQEVFYQKTLVKKDSLLKTIYFTYPKAKKALYDKITSHIAKSFKHL